MKIDEAREKILAIFSDTAADVVEDGELPERFMVDFIERTITVCGPQYLKSDYDKEEIINCIEALKESIESYRKTTQNFDNITTNNLPEIGELIEHGGEEKIKIASTKLKTIQKSLKEEIISASNAIELFQEQVSFIRKIPHFDAVTKLHNAFSFVNDMLPILKVGGGRDLDMGLLLIEVANYESIISEHGDKVYNKVLIYITRILKGHIRSENKIYKYNHNTFLVLFNRSQSEDLRKTRERIISQLSKNAIEYQKKPVDLTICSAEITHKKNDTIDFLIDRLQKNKVCVKQD